MNIFVGSYALKGDKAIYHYEVNKNGFKLISSVDSIENPSYLAISDDKKHIFCVSETETYNGEYGGSVCIFKYENNKFELLDNKKTNGSAPCHIVQKDNHLFVSNYFGGSVSMFKLSEDFNSLEMCDLVKHIGNSINIERQEASHVHFCDFIDGKLWAADLGTDTIMCYNVIRDKLEFSNKINLYKGTGVRHFVKNENGTIFAICELSSEILVIRNNEVVQRISTLPNGFSDSNCAGIKIYKDLIFASNRGHDSIAVYQINDEKLKLIEIFSTKGKTPRDFLVSDDYIVVANQGDNKLELFNFDYAIKKISYANKNIKCASPVCVIS